MITGYFPYPRSEQSHYRDAKLCFHSSANQVIFQLYISEVHARVMQSESPSINLDILSLNLSSCFYVFLCYVRLKSPVCRLVCGGD